MGARSDALLAVVVLVAAAVASVLVDVVLSPSFLAVGAVSTLVFEAIAARDPDAVRRYWERPAVQGATLVVALAGVVVGARVAPSIVLSFTVGSLVTYLVFLAVTNPAYRS
ncbi:hypothetical protein HYG81_07765 [Natrinema zhouii]|uniref:Uncharacterized protein n=1 Tax=Natrinema zhouii TaxID=1710539 RepID=A0A7D6H1K9_9EURY|nr:hypothetical protein [Natrinema zhouii]QLK27485.1 hypothetical protein HYG81_07765 [Natrinema zhouii]